MRRCFRVEEEKETREIDRGGAREAGGSEIARGNAPARQLTHARILLKTDEGTSPDAPGEAWPGTRIADALEISRSTVRRVRERFVEEGLEAALVHRKPIRGRSPRSWMAPRRRI